MRTGRGNVRPSVDGGISKRQCAVMGQGGCLASPLICLMWSVLDKDNFAAPSSFPSRLRFTTRQCSSDTPLRPSRHICSIIFYSPEADGRSVRLNLRYHFDQYPFTLVLSRRQQHTHSRREHHYDGHCTNAAPTILVLVRNFVRHLDSPHAYSR